MLLLVLLFPREADTDLRIAPLSSPPVPERPRGAAEIFQSELHFSNLSLVSLVIANYGDQLDYWVGEIKV